MLRFLVTLLLQLSVATFASCAECPPTIPPQTYLHLSTQTPYFPADCAANYHSPPSSVCSLRQYHIVSRHGVRIPSFEDIDSFNILIKLFQNPQISSIISQSEYSNFLNITNPFDNGYYMEDQLSLNGQQAMSQTAQRLLQDNYDFFAPKGSKDLPFSSKFFNPDSYLLRSTYKSRTGQSLSAFMYGLTKGFGSMDNNNYLPINAKAPDDEFTPDLLLRFFDSCSKWTKEIHNNPDVQAMEDKWNEKIFPQIVKNVNERFGLSNYPSLAFDTETVQILYSYCANYYSLTYDPQYCTIFTDEERDLIEYADDMEMFYEYGYGFNISAQMAAPYLQNLWSMLSAEAIYVTAPKYWGSIRVGHAETISPILALMGLFKDDFLLTENISAQQFEERKWRNEQMSGYGASIQIMMYGCPQDNNKNNQISTMTNNNKNKQNYQNINETSPNTDYYIRILHNEKEVIIPGCEGVYCKFGTLKNVWSESLSVNYEEVCENF